MKKKNNEIVKAKDEIVKYDFENIREKLKLKSFDTKKSFSEKYTKADSYLKSKGFDISRIRENSAKLVGAGALLGSLLLSPPISLEDGLNTEEFVIEGLRGEKNVPIVMPEEGVIDMLSKLLPKKPRPLSRIEEKYLERVFEDVIGVPARATLEGEHLNTTYGYIGAEQHLKRYPGDRLTDHLPREGEYGFDNPQEIVKEGIAPGLGAWGYFASSREKLSDDLREVEKWYAVVQTLYLPDWNMRAKYLKDWYKYRKVLIVNPENGKALVASIADSGPAAWTGKHFGGSPEVMNYLGGAKYKKGAVVVFFVDDPNNSVPLGPVRYNIERLPGLKT